jgi:hypothetical protein
MRQLWKRAGSFGKPGGASRGSAQSWERDLTTPRPGTMPSRRLHQCRPKWWVCASRDGGRDNLGLENAPDRWIRPEAGGQASVALKVVLPKWASVRARNVVSMPPEASGVAFYRRVDK